MNCQEIRKWLDAYCDGELDLPRSLDLEQHLNECADCTVSYRNLLALHSGIRGSGFVAPEALRERISVAVRKQLRPVRKTSRSFGSWLGWGLMTATASVILAFVFTRVELRSNRTDRVLSEITDSHIRSLMGTHLVDVASSDQHTVRPWFEGKIDFAPPVPDLSEKGFEIVGGRLDYIEARPVATLVYQCRKHYLNLFIRPDAGAASVSEAPVEVLPSQRGYQIVHWTAGGLNYWAVSEISIDELRDFANAFKKETAGR